VLAAFALSCGGGSAGAPSPDALAFTIQGMSLRLSSGAAAISSGVLTLYVSDQIDTCTALRNAKTGNPPIGIYTVLALHVAAGSDGSTHATVVAPTPLPGPGQAAGTLARSQGGHQAASLDAADGTVSWTLDARGSATIRAMDVGFSGTADRLAASALPPLPACSL
jgi:hypothetical protein